MDSNYKLKSYKVLKKISDINSAYFFQGSIKNVLSRYYEISKKSDADYIVRITADCPLVDSSLIDKAIKKIQIHDCDYVSNTIKRTYPDGLDVEVFSWKALKRTYNSADHPFLKQHVTTYMHGRVPKNIKSGRFNIKQFSNKKNYANYRITLDQNEDLDLIRKIYSNLNDFCSWEEVISLMKKKPDLKNINGHINLNEGSKINLRTTSKKIKIVNR